MEKMLKNLKKIIVILLVVLVSLIAFIGIYVNENGVWRNIIPSYKCGKDIEGARELKYALDTSEEEKYVYVDENGNVVGEVLKDGSSITAEDEASSTEEGQASENTSEEIPYSKETRMIKANSDDKLTKENFEVAKKIIQKRFKKQDISDYSIRVDDVTGKLVIETNNDNDNVSLIESLIEQPGKFKIIDYQNGLVLMDNSDIKNVTVVSSNDSSYSTYLQIEFNETGKQKLKEISTKYVETKNEDISNEATEESTEEATAEESDIKYISVMFDDTKMMTTYFGEEMSNGILQIPAGQSTTDYNEFLENYNSTKIIADVLNSGVLPITYSIETDNFVKSEITTSNINTIKIISAVVIGIISLIFIIKYKKNGILGAILSIGYIAALSLIIKYTNVVMTENSVITYGIIILINYIFMNMILKGIQNEKMEKVYSRSMKKFYLALIPLCVIAIVFTFSTYTIINSIGVIVFWGIILNLLYNFIFTRTSLK